MPKITELNLTNPPELHVGTGARQLQLLKLLYKDFDPNLIYYSTVWGGSSTICKSDKTKIVLPNGTRKGMLVDKNKMLSTKHLANAIIEALVDIPPDSVILSGRPTLVRLGMNVEMCHSGAIYDIHVIMGKTTEIKPQLIVSGVILAK